MMSPQKAMKLEIIVSQPARNWLDLPSELMANILQRVGVVDILHSAQKVCTAWREICKDPAMWTVLYMDPNANLQMCKHVVDRSQGQLVDITIVDFGNDEILEYIANRCCQLKRLTIVSCDEMYEGWRESLEKFPLLEELNVYATDLSVEGIETAGLYCPMLKSLKVNQKDFRSCYEPKYSYCGWGCSAEDKSDVDDEVAMYIGRHLHELRHLELIGSMMTNEGLEMILDGCHHLESLDLRGCFEICLHGDLGRRCLQQIKFVKLPDDSLEGCPYVYQIDGMTCDDESNDESVEGSYAESDIELEDKSEGGFNDE